jgi:hypothetical protein
LKLLGADDHHVDILAFQDLLVVLVDRPVALLLVLVVVGRREIAVAQGNEPPVLGQLIEQHPGPPADADPAHADAVVGAWLALGRQHAGRDEIRSRERAGRRRGAATEQFSA